MALPPASTWRRLVAPLLVLVALSGLAAVPASAATGGTAPEPDPEATEPDMSVQIVGGDEAPAGAWPSQVALVFSSQPVNRDGQFCGGTLVAWSWVLTAAHCLKDNGANPDDPEPIEWAPADVDVLVGTQDLESGGTRVPAVRFVLHPGWDPDVGRDDLALVQLDRPAPAGTPFQALTGATGTPAAGTDVVVTGWGTQQYGVADYPSKLRQVTVDVTAPADCAAAYGGYYQQSTMVCAARAGRDACQGDSGGPLVESRAGTWVQVGVISTGYECARDGYPGIYTSVAAYAGWIAQTIRYGPHADAATLVRRMHLDAFDRQPTAAELSAGTAALAGGQLPQVHAWSILDGATYRARTGGVIRLYQSVFLRRPDTAGLGYWWGEVNHGVSLARIAEKMVAAPEFRTMYGALDDAAFVTRVYQNVLGRTPTAEEAGYWVGELASRARTRGRVMVGFSESAESKALTAGRVVTIGAYFALVRRVPSPADIDAWSAAPAQSLVTALIKSREYALRL